MVFLAGHIWHALRVRTIAAGLDFQQGVINYADIPEVGNFATPVNASGITQIYLENLPIYRQGLSPFARGLEIGMAHGYFLIGPFVKLGFLRNTESANLAGLAATIGLLFILSVCLSLYASASFQEKKPAIFGYLVGLKNNSWTLLGMNSVDNLEDVIGGHIWISLILIAGGAWHILVPPFVWVRRIFPIANGEEILSYSLLGLALMGFIYAVFVGYNMTVFPPEFYGKDRLGSADIQFFLGVLAFSGFVWHSWRSRQA